MNRESDDPKTVAPPSWYPAAGARTSPSYYDASLLKPPVWRWEIATYFFLGGLSAGAFLLSRAAGLRPRHRAARRAGTALALAALVPSPPLLIKDLGVPRRFPYMLRIFKPRSPMNLGSWVLTAYGATVSLASLREWIAWRRGPARSRAGRAMTRAADVITEGLGIPLGLLMASYTAVLLSTTATPLWSRNRWLGPLFSAGALRSGAGAIGLALEVAGAGEPETLRALRRIDTAAGIGEAAALAGYVAAAGPLAEPVLRGRYAPHLLGGAVLGGLVLPELLRRLPVGASARRALRLGSAVLGLLGGFALRWALVHGGRPSARDPRATRAASGVRPAPAEEPRPWQLPLRAPQATPAR